MPKISDIDGHDETRRSFLQSAAAVLIAAGCGCANRALSEEENPGCIVLQEEFDQRVELPDVLDRFDEVEAAKRFDPQRSPILNRSHDPKFDRALDRQLRGMNTQFSLRPSFGYYRDDNAPNALASAHRRVPNTDGTVVFGLTLLRQCLRQSNGELSALTICAHEWGHILQFNQGYIRRITSVVPDYCVELHADFLAGYYLAIYREQAPGADLQVVGQTWERMGSGEYNRPGSHGTSRQRIDAIEAGYRFYRQRPSSTIGNAAEQGYRHVLQYRRS